ncbi:MAG: DUF6516 family protein [Nitrospirae bacterium]|nr:DUF6516 family protein [Nitrospirota bacterium]
MLLTEYLSELIKVLDEYSKTNLIIDSNLSIDSRTGKIGIIKGAITFLDNSMLVFSEYLDLRYKVEKDSYSFHYQKQDGTLIFRYDNALHKPPLDAAGHKHISDDKVISAEPPGFEEILTEVMDLLL